VRDLEVGKLFVVRQFEVSDRSNPFSYCFVEGDDSGMEAGVSDGEQRGDILSICREFVESVREGIGGCSDSTIPGNGPFPSITDAFGRFNRSKREFEVPQLFDLDVIVGGGELTTEDGIEIDGDVRRHV
jgi:hypothetical protein